MQNKQIAKLHSSISTLHSQTLSFTTTKETVCEASESNLCACGYTLHDETRVTQQSPPYDARITPEGRDYDAETIF